MLIKARMLMAVKKIRHIPVIDADSGTLIGMLDQKSVLANAIKIINQRGLEQLEYIEKSMDIGSIMDKQPVMFELAAPLSDVANRLLNDKCGCAAIIDHQKLVGVITSHDFLKLALTEN